MCIHRLLLIIVAAIGTMVPLNARATDVAVELLDGRTVKGDLLVVRDSALIVDLKPYRPMWDKNHSPCVVSFDSIRVVWVKSGSYGVTGAVCGLVAGAVAGAIIEPPSSKSMVAPVGPGVGALAGLAIGFVVGSGIHTTTGYTTTTPDGFGELRPFSRFDNEEPDWLKEIH